MLRSMFSAVSGLRTHATFLDVVGNNIANVNTIGFKASQMVFSDLLSQVLQSASGAEAVSGGGTNPAAIGLGVTLGGIRASFTQGASQLTGRATDLAIQGDGFFIVSKDTGSFYTRAGSLTFDSAGNLVTPDGGVIQGWLASNGTLNTQTTPVNLQMPLGQMKSPAQTQNITFGGNLPSDMPLSPATGSAVTSSITMYDPLGTPKTLTLTFTHTAAGTYSLSAAGDTGTVAMGNVTFNTSGASTGEISSATSLTLSTANLATLFGGTWNNASTLDFGAPTDPARLRSFAGSSSAAATSQDGSAMGFLRSFAIDKTGVITGTYSNGATQTLGQIALASFSNPAGLMKVGESLYQATVNSGEAQVGAPGSGGRGSLQSATLEMSNVELAQEFTNLIVAQRGFMANSRVVTASDQILQDLVNMAR